MQGVISVAASNQARVVTIGDSPFQHNMTPPGPPPTPPLLSNLALICTLRPNSSWQQLFTESDTWWCFKKRSPHVRQVLGPLIPAPPGVGFPTLGLRWLEAGNLKITIIWITLLTTVGIFRHPFFIPHLHPLHYRKLTYTPGEKSRIKRELQFRFFVFLPNYLLG